MYCNIQLGLRLHDTDKKLSFPERLGIARAQGFTCVHLALSKIPGLCADPAALTPGYAAAIRRAFDKEGLSLAVLPIVSRDFPSLNQGFLTSRY